MAAERRTSDQTNLPHPEGLDTDSPVSHVSRLEPAQQSLNAVSSERPVSPNEETSQLESLIPESNNDGPNEQSQTAEPAAREGQKPLVNTEERQREGKMSKPKKPVGYIRAWMWEVMSVVLAIVALIASIVVLGVYNGKTLPEWPRGITLNTVISIFSTALKALILVAVAEGSYETDFSQDC
jgi:Protein of unknown function (DUF3176)